MGWPKVNLSEIKDETSNKLNVLVHKDDIEIVNDREDVQTIGPEDTLAMAAKFTERTWALAKTDEDFKRRLAVVYPDTDIATDERQLAEYPIAFRHVVGLIVCTNRAINMGKIPFWNLPETYLHPSTQQRITELMMTWIKDWEAYEQQVDEKSGEESV